MGLIRKATQKKYSNMKLTLKSVESKDVMTYSIEKAALSPEELVEKSLAKSSNVTIISYESDVEYVLKEEIESFFPKSGVWYSSCFERSEELTREIMPCHLRNYRWLSKLLHNELKIFKRIYIEENQVLAYIKNSERFQELRHNYELEIVRWQINYMKNNGEGWIIPEGYGDFSMFGPNCDKFFRASVVATLSSIGLNLDAIEEGLEKYASMWREIYMRITFRNIYEPISCMAKNQLDGPQKELKDTWLKLRKYQYYVEHKNSVDKYGMLEPEMMLAENQVEVLKLNLQELDKERKIEIANWKNSSFDINTSSLDED